MTEKFELPEYDPTKWIRGEWDNEPNRVDFIHAGFSCFILRAPIGHLCGYVGVPNTHSCYNKHYNDIDVDVHGGLTYGEKCQGVICHIPEPGMPDDVKWFGFDCAHSGDLSPSIHMRFMHSYTTYRNIGFVTREVKSLAEQLAKLA
jgi:hypothetical protein